MEDRNLPMVAAILRLKNLRKEYEERFEIEHSLF